MKKKEFNFKRFATSVIYFIVIACLFASMILIYYNAGKAGEVCDISNGWTILIDDTEYDNADLDTFEFPQEGGEISHIVMERVLTGEESSKATTLRIYSRLSHIRVEIDGVCIYSSLAEDGDKDFLGMGYHFVQIPIGEGDQNLTLHVESGEKNAIRGLPELCMTTTEVAFSHYVDDNAVGIFSAIFIFVFGIIVTIIGSIYTAMEKDFFRLFLIGSFSLAIGLWCICSQKILLLLSVDMGINSTLEYFALEFSFLPLIGFDIKTKENATKRELFILRCFLSATLLLDVISLLFHMTDVLHYPQTVIAFHIMALADCLAMLFVGARPYRALTSAGKEYHIAQVALTLFVFWNVYGYINRNYVVRGASMVSGNLLPMICVLFVSILLISYVTHYYDMIRMQVQDDVLQKMAYRDSLTGLYNRAECARVFARLDEQETKNYAIIEFDLNGLRSFNERYGHAKGDIFLTTFGRVLKEIFDDHGTCIRMGDDEFVVLLEDEATDGAAKDLEHLVKKLKRESKELKITIETSYGIAKSNEISEPKGEAVLRLADERMCEMKKKSKKDGGKER